MTSTACMASARLLHLAGVLDETTRWSLPTRPIAGGDTSVTGTLTGRAYAQQDQLGHDHLSAHLALDICIA